MIRLLVNRGLQEGSLASKICDILPNTAIQNPKNWPPYYNPKYTISYQNTTFYRKKLGISARMSKTILQDYTYTSYIYIIHTIYICIYTYIYIYIYIALSLFRAKNP